MTLILVIVGALVIAAVVTALALHLYGKRIPVGHVVACEINLKRSPQEVYDLVADVPGHVNWAPNVRGITEAPPDNGRPAYRMRVDRQEMYFFVSAAEPPRTFTLTVPGDKMFRGTWTWDITQTPGVGGGGAGCTVRLTERGEIFVAFVRAMLRVLGMETKYLALNLSGMAKHFNDPARPRRVA